METLWRLARDTGDVLLHIEELELVCEEGDRSHDHGVLRNEVGRARMFNEIKALMVNQALRSLLEATVCEYLVLR